MYMNVNMRYALSFGTAVSLIALTWEQMVFNFRGSASGPIFLRP
jgi:hypothetical protein